MSVSSPSYLETGQEFNFEQSVRPHQYIVQACKMLKCPVLLSTLSLMLVATLLIMSAHGAPALTPHAPRSSSDYAFPTDLLYTPLPSPPSAHRDQRQVDSPSIAPALPTAPRKLPFIKNTQCTLHLPGGETSSKMCGLRQLDVANGDSGIKSWKPSRCRPFHCKCVATKEVQRTKRTIADNKTTLDYHRYRVYECV